MSRTLAGIDCVVLFSPTPQNLTVEVVTQDGELAANPFSTIFVEGVTSFKSAWLARSYPWDNSFYAFRVMASTGDIYYNMAGLGTGVTPGWEPTADSKRVAQYEWLGLPRVTSALQTSSEETSTGVPTLASYSFIGSTTSSSVNGFFTKLVNNNIVRVGGAFTYTITASAAVTLATMAGGTLPEGATGVIWDVSQDLRVEIADSSGSFTMTQGNKTSFPTIALGLGQPLGKVN